MSQSGSLNRTRVFAYPKKRAVVSIMNGRAMTQAVSRQPLTAEARVRDLWWTK
jgi:hypothetical protein